MCVPTMQHIQLAVQHNKQPPSMLWDKLPAAVDPIGGINSSYIIFIKLSSLSLRACLCYYCGIGNVPLDRAQRKRQQIENMVDHVQHLMSGGNDIIVDFCAGGVSVLQMPLWR